MAGVVVTLLYPAAGQALRECSPPPNRPATGASKLAPARSCHYIPGRTMGGTMGENPELPGSSCPTRESGGEIGIRTLDRLPPILDFESSAFDHSAISPEPAIIPGPGPAPQSVRRFRGPDDRRATGVPKATDARRRRQIGVQNATAAAPLPSATQPRLTIARRTDRSAVWRWFASRRLLKNRNTGSVSAAQRPVASGSST